MGESCCRVILNDRCLRNPRTGVGRYVTELLAGLDRVAPEVDILSFYSRFRPSPSAAGDSQRPARRSRRPPDWFRRIGQGFYDTAFEAIGSARGYSLYHEPNHIPVAWHGPILTTVHDVSVLRHPEWHPADRVAWYEREFAAGAARTHHFVTVSRFTRNEMVDLLGIPAERITVIPLGVHPPARSEPRPAISSSTPPPCLLFVGTLEPRKNVPGLLEAYASLPVKLRERFPLVIAGMSGWGRDDVSARAARLGIIQQTFVMGYVSEQRLDELYRSARALVWPTLYEGFGLPPLEAMARGTPVITSRVSSLPEVVGDAALLVDPLSVEQIAEAMRRLIEDDALHQDLSQRGPIRAAQFSWDRCAAAHAALYHRFADRD